MRLRIDIKTRRAPVRAAVITALVSSICVCVIKMNDGTVHDGVYIKHVEVQDGEIIVLALTVHNYIQLRLPLRDIRDITIH